MHNDFYSILAQIQLGIFLAITIQSSFYSQKVKFTSKYDKYLHIAVTFEYILIVVGALIGTILNIYNSSNLKLEVILYFTLTAAAYPPLDYLFKVLDKSTEFHRYALYFGLAAGLIFIPISLMLN